MPNEDDLHIGRAVLIEDRFEGLVEAQVLCGSILVFGVRLASGELLWVVAAILACSKGDS